MTIYIGENIKKLRLENNLTQDKLSEYLGVSFQTISNWERNESYPDITILPEIAAFFNVSTDELLGMNKAEAEKKLSEYIDIYEKNRYKDTSATFKVFQKAINDFPSDYKILVRHMELMMCEITNENPEYKKASDELQSIYEKIQSYCTDDSIRMWSKRLICQHLHTKAHYSKDIELQKKAETILSEMPEMLNSREYLSTMLLTNKEQHSNACSNAIEKLIFLLEHSIDHYCLYDESFSAEYKIEALSKMLLIYNTFYTDGNFGKSWQDVIYNHGHLGYLYESEGNAIKAAEHLKLSAEYAVKYDSLPTISDRNSQFFEGMKYKKTPQGKTMCERLIYLFTEKYPLSKEFKSSTEFKEILIMLKENRKS